MPDSRPVTEFDQKPPLNSPMPFRELDRIKLIKEITLKGRAPRIGLEGTVVYCRGGDAYEVEFPGINDFFQISRENLQKT